MIRKKNAAGLALFCFGAGMIFSVFLQGGLCAVIVGLAAMVAGAVLLCGNGA